MAVTVTWLGHASFRIQSDTQVIYVDPWKIHGTPHDGQIILVSHSHYDHYSPDDIENAAGDGCQLISAKDVIEKQGSGLPLIPGQTVKMGDTEITTVAAYNVNKHFHPRDNQWLGFVIALEGKRIYFSGDTDAAGEMAGLKAIDLALLPVGGTYTLDGHEAAEAVNQFKPVRAIPYHWGDIVGKRRDADAFAGEATCQAIILIPGESIEL